MKLLSLNEICLKEIVASFDRFNGAYCSGNALLKRNFEFLQRVYSQEIMCMLCKADNIKEEYLNFLLNPYLKELDLQKLVHCDWEVIMKRLVQVGYGIQKLVMCEYSAKEISRCLSSVDVLMNHIPNVKVLHLHHICTDEHLKILAKCCHGIIELEVNDSVEVSNEGVKDLFSKDENGFFSHSTLQIINLDGTRVNDEGIAFLLENIPSLQVINYPNLPRVIYAMHKKDLERNTLHKARKYNLTELDVMCLAQSPILHDILLICIKLCPHIKNLYFPVMKQEEIDLLSKFSELQNVQLEIYRTENNIDVNNFLKVRGPSLTTLKLRGFTVSLYFLAQNCPRLTTLKLSNSSFQLDNSDIPLLKNLQEFILCGADFSEESARAVADSVMTSSPVLEKLSFLNCEEFNPQLNFGILKCCTHCFIKYVDFTGSDVEYALLHNIVDTCSTLESLAIDSCMNITSENIQHLCELASNTKNRPQIVSLEYFGSDYSYSDYDLFDPYDAFDFYDSYDDDEDSYDDYFDDAYDPNDDIDDSYDI